MSEPTTFAELGISEPTLRVISELGYEQPSPIQAESIPALLTGSDLIGQAQTGTGKTAAFALPLLSKIDAKKRAPQLLILTPTRELAIQVAEACQKYAKYIKGLTVLPIYGGQSYSIQLKQLNRGAQVVVGTPGRVMDHMRRKTLCLDNLNTIVLDEADEMLRMGFIDDVKWVLEQAPQERQIALFSATMPREVKKVADNHLHDPVHIKIAGKAVTAPNIEQSYWIVRGTHKLDAITRILENEETAGVIVFVRTKNATVELADKLSARGFRSEALNGDIPQANREKVVARLRSAKLDILVATDVVARGLDVERISHVINYDVPHDTESYIHRIGRTGRAGRSGKAIIFVAPREKRMLYAIERATKQKIEAMDLPSVDDINQSRVARFKARVVEAISSENLDLFSQIIAELQAEEEVSSEQIAAASAYLAQGGNSLLLDQQSNKFELSSERQRGPDRKSDRERKPRHEAKPAPAFKPVPLKDFSDLEMGRFILYVGHRHRVKPGSIVGCIANEAELESKYIGEIEIREEYSTVDLPADMPKDILAILKRARVCNRPLRMERFTKVPKDSDWNSSSSPKKRKLSKAKSPSKAIGAASNNMPAGKKSYNSRKTSQAGNKKPTSDYAKKKQKQRNKKKGS